MYKILRRSRLRRRPKFCPAGEKFENRGLFSRKSFRKNVFRPGSRAPKTGFLGHLFLKSQKRCPFFVRQADDVVLFQIIFCPKKIISRSGSELHRNHFFLRFSHFLPPKNPFLNSGRGPKCILVVGPSTVAPFAVAGGHGIWYSLGFHRFINY